MIINDLDAAVNDPPNSIVWGDWVNGLADWKSFITLTFDTADRTHDVTREECIFKWRRLVQALNNDLFGHHYTRIVGHSYFSYVLSLEYQKRGVLHMHSLVDERINFDLVHRFWGHIAGFAFIQKIEDRVKTCRYICKYVVKGDDLELFVQKKKKIPAFLPYWYQQA